MHKLTVCARRRAQYKASAALKSQVEERIRWRSGSRAEPPGALAAEFCPWTAARCPERNSVSRPPLCQQWLGFLNTRYGDVLKVRGGVMEKQGDRFISETSIFNIWQPLSSYSFFP